MRLVPFPVTRGVWRWAVAGTVLLLAGVGGYWYGLAWRERPVASPPAEQVIGGLAVPASALDLGEVWESSHFTCQLPVRNTTSQPISVKAFQGSCWCVEIYPSSLALAPGEQTSLEVHLNLTHRQPAEVHQEKRPFTVDVTPAVPSPPRREAWTVRGTVRSRVTFRPFFLHFGEEVISGESPPTRTAAAQVHIPHQGLDIRTDPDLVTVEAVPMPEPPGRFELRVTPRPSLPPGPFESRLTVDVVAPDGERLPGAVLPVGGTVQPEVRPLPARILLGSHPVGTKAEATVVLQARPGVSWSVDHIETDSADVQVDPVAPPGALAGRAFRVVQRIGREGDQAGAVRFVLRRPGQELLTLATEVCYHGQAAPAPGGR